MDIAKCLYHSDNNRFVDRWDLKKKFGYLANTVSNTKYEPPHTYYMHLDNTDMEGNNHKLGGVSVEILKPSIHCDTVSDMKKTPNLNCVAPVTKPKRSRNGFTSIFQFISGFIGTKSLLSARMQPLRFRDTSRPTLNVGSIFEMYQESCLVEDSIRNSRKSEGQRSGESGLGENCSSTPKVPIQPVEMGKSAEAGSSPEEMKCSGDVQVCLVSQDSTCKSSTSDSDMQTPHLQPADTKEVAMESDTEPTPDKIDNCASNSSMATTDTVSSDKTMPSTPVEVSKSNNHCAKQTQDGRRRQQRCSRNNTAEVQSCGSETTSSEQKLNMKNNLLSMPCSQTKPCIPGAGTFITNGETFSQKRVNDHAVSKNQKRSRKRSRRKARRQRKKSPPPACSNEQQTVHIPDVSCAADTAVVMDEPDMATSTPSPQEVEAQVSHPVGSPICFVQPLCANAAIAFILGVCSDDSDSDDDDGFEWDIGGDDSWEKSNALWESFQQCAQLQLSNLKSPVVATPSPCSSGIAADSLDSLCADEVDGTDLADTTYDDAFSDTVGSEDSCREYPNGNQLSAEQLLDVNRRWTEEIEKAVIPCDKRKQDKKVHFAADGCLHQVRHMFTWSYAHRAARKGEWEQYARDRARFQTRIHQVEKTIGYVLAPEHRSQVYKKYHDLSNR